MGTRSLTFIYDNERTSIASRLMCMYRQYDGYPSGHGKELHDFLAGGRMVNGYGAKDAKLFNGMGCLAAQMVANFKVEVGNFYLLNPAKPGDCWQEYEYHVYYGKDFRVVVKNPIDVVFDGNLAEFKAFCEKGE